MNLPARPTAADVPLLLLRVLGGSGGSEPSVAVSSTTNRAAGTGSHAPHGAGIMDAVATELEARLRHDDQEHANALAIVVRLGTRRGAYSAEPGGVPSFLATILASWIRQRRAPLTDLVGAGVCQSAYICSSDSPPAILPPLQVAAAETALMAPADDSFPLPY
jgi:hypothetical protein